MFEELILKGAFVYTPKVFEDSRGFFLESYNKELFHKNGIKSNFIQDNHSKSMKKNIIRGLHFQKGEYSQGKLIRCIRGAILDVLVDLRLESKTYLKWESVEINEENKKQVFIPRGFAHGFITLENNTEVFYKVDNVYNKESERTIIYNDEIIGIDWGIDINNNIILSDKDLAGVKFKDLDF